jgi:hypothetical protein
VLIVNLESFEMEALTVARRLTCHVCVGPSI